MELLNQGSLLSMILDKVLGANSPTATAKPTKPLAPYPTVDLNNPSAEMLRQAQVLFPGAAPAQLADYIKANPESFKYGPGLGNPYQPSTTKTPDLGAAIDKLGASVSGVPGAAPGGAASNAVTGMPTMAPAPPLPAPNYAGTGPVQGMPNITPSTMMTAMKGPASFPLGPASLNPFMLALLKARLGG